MHAHQLFRSVQHWLQPNRHTPEQMVEKVAIEHFLHALLQNDQSQSGLEKAVGMEPRMSLSGTRAFTPRAGRRPWQHSWPRWAPWIRCRWTSSLAEGSVQKWSDVFSLVYSRAQGPTGRKEKAKEEE
uniref:SCAN box domain-containing protein n=1 Tax=Paramormyrops kingsleyae TaxID=1676925 RepID=A0A3B3SJV9_9TELE